MGAQGPCTLASWLPVCLCAWSQRPGHPPCVPQTRLQAPVRPLSQGPETRAHPRAAATGFWEELVTAQGGSSWPHPAWTAALRCPCCRPALVYTPAVHPNKLDRTHWSAARRRLHRPDPTASASQQTETLLRRREGLCSGALPRRGGQRPGDPGPSSRRPGCGQPCLDAGQGGGAGPWSPGLSACWDLDWEDCFTRPQSSGLPPPTSLLHSGLRRGSWGFLTEASGFWTRGVLPQGANCGGCD